MRHPSIFNLIQQNNVTKESLSKLKKRFPQEGLQLATLYKEKSDGQHI
jgi:hypothetical protein